MDFGLDAFACFAYFKNQTNVMMCGELKLDLYDLNNLQIY